MKKFFKLMSLCVLANVLFVTAALACNEGLNSIIPGDESTTAATDATGGVRK